MRTFFALLMLAGTVLANSYSTNFPSGEMVSGRWLQGKTNGANWCNVVNVPGLAYGTQDGSQPFNDSTAVVVGAWGNDQSAQATVSVPVNQSSISEVELRLRTSISPGSITGYEFNGSVSAGGGAYMQIVRWNGPINNFTKIGSSAVLLHSGDVIMATAKGNVLTLYRNGTAICSASDSTFPSGAPGVGMFSNVGAADSGFGLANFSATDSGSPTPTPSPSATPPPQAYAAWESSLINELHAAGIQQSRINTVQTWLANNPPKP